MGHLYVVRQQENHPDWEAYPSWGQFSWLYLMSALSALRGALLYRFGVVGWEMWMVGAGMLIGWAAILRRWAHYEFTKDQIMVRKGYTGRKMQSVLLSDILKMTIRQGIVDQFFGTGTLVIYSRTTDRTLSLRGLNDPEEAKVRIEALLWKQRRRLSGKGSEGL